MTSTLFDRTIVHNPKNLVGSYQGHGRAFDQRRMGYETEIGIFKREDDGRVRIASPQECADLIQSLQEQGLRPQQEIVSAVEFASCAHRVDRITPLVEEIRDAYRDLHQGILDAGFSVSPYALHPFLNLETACDNLVQREDGRPQALVAGMTKLRTQEHLKVTTLGVSSQVSLDYSNPEDLLDTLRTGYALSPVITALFANHPPYVEGNMNAPVTGNPRAQWYGEFGRDGGIAKSVLDATNGQDFIRRHIEQVYDTPLLYYYDHSGDIQSPDQPVTFRDLHARSLNIAANYRLAETFLYYDMKVCGIRDCDGNIEGMRAEVRGFDGGEPGVSGAVPFLHATLRDPVASAATKILLSEYGFDPQDHEFADRLQKARDTVANHNGKYMDVPFGLKVDGAPGNMKEFCNELGGILKDYALRQPETVRQALAPVIEICETGINRAQIIARTWPANENAIGTTFSGSATPGSTTVRVTDLSRGNFSYASAPGNSLK